MGRARRARMSFVFPGEGMIIDGVLITPGTPLAGEDQLDFLAGYGAARKRKRMDLDKYVVLIEIEDDLLNDEFLLPLIIEHVWAVKLQDDGGVRLPGPLYFTVPAYWPEESTPGSTWIKISGPASRRTDTINGPDNEACPGCGYPLPHHEAKCQYRGLGR